MELQDFVDQAAQMLQLGDQLRSRRQENDRLRHSLITNRIAKVSIEKHVDPMESTVSELTRTTVMNWLEMIRLREKTDNAQRDLIESENSWLMLRKRTTTLRLKLVERRAELISLKTESAALAAELGFTRQQIAQRKSDMHRFEHQQQEIVAATTTLRQTITSGLRAVLLESGKH
jgi:predicted  nucleic acid-binding Zn-ribbon protein